MSAATPPPRQPQIPQHELVQLFTLFNARRYAEMEAHAQGLLQHHPQAGELWKALAVALQAQGKDAVPALQRAIHLLPRDAELPGNLGTLLKDQGRHEEAVASYARALALKPDFAEAHSNLSLALMGLGRFEEAAESCRRALALKPALAEAHNNLGTALKWLGQPAEAVVSFRQAVALRPGMAVAHNGLGQVLSALGRFEDAVGSYRQALALRADWAEAHNDLGHALQALVRLDDAMACYHRALQLQPDFVLAHRNLGAAFRQLGGLDDALACYRRVLEIDPDHLGVRSDLLFILNYQAEPSAALLLEEARQYGQAAARQARPHADWAGSMDPRRCLRVGLVSADLREHPVGYFAQAVLEALAAQAAGRIELFAYANHGVSDALTARLHACCAGWHEVLGWSDEQLAGQIHEDAIDILLDLSGHTAGNRLPVFAWKPAPVQASWLGYCATTGLGAMDHFIGDPWITPAEAAPQFTESLVRLPETFLCFTPPSLDMPVGPLPALAHGHVTFGCFNKAAKMNDAVVALWAQVLHAVPGSSLLLKAGQLDPAAVQARFARDGIDAGRLLVEGLSPRADYLAAYGRVDMALDPFPYPGGTTSVEGLWMGVPVLTLAGERALSRQGESILQCVGLPDWIARDADDYLARAVRHAGDLPALAGLRQGLRQRLLASPLCDAPRFAGHLEAALRGVWVSWCAARDRAA